MKYRGSNFDSMLYKLYVFLYINQLKYFQAHLHKLKEGGNEDILQGPEHNRSTIRESAPLLSNPKIKFGKTKPDYEGTPFLLVHQNPQRNATPVIKTV